MLKYLLIHATYDFIFRSVYIDFNIGSVSCHFRQDAICYIVLYFINIYICTDGIWHFNKLFTYLNFYFTYILVEVSVYISTTW